MLEIIPEATGSAASAPSANGEQLQLTSPGEAGTTAVLHGILAMLSEELGRMNSRLGALEEAAAVPRPEVRPEELATAVGEAVGSHLSSLGTLLGERLDRVEARVAEAAAAAAAAPPAPEPLRAEELADAVGQALTPDLVGLGQRLAGLESTVAETLAQSQSASERVGSEVGATVLRALASVETSLESSGARIGERLAALDGAVDRLNDAVADRVGERVGDLEAALVGLESNLRQAIADSRTDADLGSELIDAAREMSEHLGAMRHVRAIIDEFGPAIPRIEAGVDRLHEQTEMRSAALAGELRALVGEGVERLVARGIETDNLVSGELRVTRLRLDEVAAAVAAVEAATTEVRDLSTRMADEGRAQPVLDAIEAASRETGDAIGALHQSIARRVESWLGSIREQLDAVGAVGPALQGMQSASETEQARLDELHRAVKGMAILLGHLPDTLSSRLSEQRDTIDRLVTDLAARHDDAHRIESSVETLRADVTEGLHHLVRRQSSAGKALSGVVAAEEDLQRRVDALVNLCQSLSGAIDQQGAVAARLTDLVLESRTALRGEVERLESAVHLEGVKRQQQDQARLAQATASTVEVVEREAAQLAQRISAMNVALESVKSVVHGQLDDPSLGARHRAG